MARLVVLILAATRVVFCQALPPAILQNGVFNSASRFAMSLPGGALAPGARFTIQGVRLADRSQKPQVDIRSGSSTVTARVLSASSERIEAVVPPRMPPGAATLTVIRGGESSRPYPLRIVSSAPGLYSLNGSGAGLGRFERLLSGQRTVVNAENPVRGGDRVRVAATGMGAGAIPRVVVGGIAAGAVRVVRQADAIEFTVPAQAPQSCFVPVYTVTGEGLVSNVVSLPVDPKGSPCNLPADWFAPGPGRRAAILLTRTSTLLEFRPGDPQAGVEERLSASFYDAGTTEAWLPIQMLPPPGSCTAIAGNYEPGGMMDALLQFGSGSNLRGLDAGPAIQVAQGEITRAVRAAGPGAYAGSLVPRRERVGRDAKPFLAPGAIQVRSAGGADVGPFQASLRADASLSWTNRDQTDIVVRAQGVTVHWAGAGRAMPILVAAVSVDRASTAAFAALCVVSPGAEHFRVPPEILANLPATVPAVGPPLSLMFVLQSPEGGVAPVSARGLDGGKAIFLGGSGRSVQFR